MANLDFAKFTFKDLDLLWPRLDQTYRYNSQEKKTEPCAESVQGAGYSIGFQLPLETAKTIRDELKKHYDDCRARNTSLPEFAEVFGMKRAKDEDGNETEFVQVTAKKRAISNDGKVNKPPKVYGAGQDAHGAPKWVDLEDKAIWTGSKGHIRVLAFPATNPEGKGGISLLLDAVIVTKPEYGSDNIEDDFGTPDAADLPDTQDAAPSEGATEGGF